MAKKFLLTIAVIVFGSLSLLMAGSTGKIRGVVTSQNGEPLIGVNVLLEGTYLGASTDQTGSYQILNIPPGKYTLIFNMIGHKPVRFEQVAVSADLSTEINAVLAETVLDLGQEVVVVAQKPIVQKDLTSTEANISKELLEVLPVSNISDVLNLQAGMIDGHLRGGRTGEINYMIDGISINDAFAGSPVMVVENNIVQELKVISGTFNAEYGQAQSGIVDINTRDGAERLTMQITTLFGDYVSAHADVFENIDAISPMAFSEHTLYFSGPLAKKVRYIASLKRTADEGHLYGKYFFKPSVPVDSISFGDNRYVSMNDYQRWSFFGKISWRPGQTDYLALSQIYQSGDNSHYDHMFRWNPFGNSREYEQSGITIVTWNHMVSNKTFVNVKYSYNNKQYRRYVFADLTDERYATDDRLRQTPSLSFYTGGTDMSWFKRRTQTHIVKSDFTSQLNAIHQVKFGCEAKYYDLLLHDIVLKKNAETNYQVSIPPSDTYDNQYYRRNPYDLAGYIQSKSEYRNFILNLGLRLDYFNANAEQIVDLSRPKTSPTRRAKPDFQLSPRIGMAYPITDRGVMHVSYGHFFQVPPFEFLYANPSRTVNPEESLSYPLGNPELKSQKTVAYEVGLQQQLTDLIGLNLTGYYKDIRNLLGTEIQTIATGEEHSGVKYGRFINLDYGQVKGFTLALEKRPGNDKLSVNVDYTYQVVKGNASDPRSVLIDNQKEPPVDPIKYMVPLDWDQTHSLNASVSYPLFRNLVLTLVGKYGSGQPYTPQAGDITTAITNSDRKPTTVSFDCFAKYSFRLLGVEWETYLKILNLFDRLNELNVYNDSGRATYTQDLYRGGEPQGFNSKAEYYARPDWFSAPRMIQIGLGVRL
jgi:hypothetical protein